MGDHFKRWRMETEFAPKHRFSAPIQLSAIRYPAKSRSAYLARISTSIFKHSANRALFQAQ